MLQQQHNSHLLATRLAKAKANHLPRHGQDRPELGHEGGARLSSTQGRSMRMPRHCGPAQAMQRASISPRPPPTSMMLREPLHSNASSSGTCAPPRRHRSGTEWAFHTQSGSSHSARTVHAVSTTTQMPCSEQWCVRHSTCNRPATSLHRVPAQCPARWRPWPQVPLREGKENAPRRPSG